MICYADTSALIKRYIGESGSEAVLGILSQTDYLVTASLTELEIWATFELSKRTRRVDSPAYRNMAKGFERDLGEGGIGLIPMDRSIHEMARRLVRQRGLKAPDAVQLASALSAKGSFGDRYLFLCADRSLLEAARLEGLRCRDVSH